MTHAMLNGCTSTTDPANRMGNMGCFLKTATTLMTGLSLSLLMGCNNAEQTTTATDVAATDGTAPTASQDVIRIATEGAYPPFNYTDASGNLMGFDVDLANALCEKMQSPCEIVAQDWDGIIPGLKAGKYDAVIAGMSITPDRQEQVDFSAPYFTNSLVFVTKDGNVFDPDDVDSLAGKSIAAQRSTVSSQWLEENIPQADAKLYDTLNNAFLDLESGRVDGLFADKVPALDWLGNDKVGYKVVGSEIDNGDSFGIAVRKGDALKQKIDSALAELKEDGTYERLSNEYFAVPATATANAG